MAVYLEAFLPLFVAINLPGVLPIFIGLTEGMGPERRRRLTLQALSVAGGLAVFVLLAGDLIFTTLGITLNDLRVGGGLILLVLSVTDLVFGDYRRRRPDVGEEDASAVGIVPIGIPLIMGPAAITTILVSQQGFGYLPTVVSLALNLSLVLVGLLYGPRMLQFFGQGLSGALAKVASLFLAAIAVAMIRAGVMGMVAAM